MTDKKSPEQQRRADLEYLVGEWAREEHVDPRSLVQLTKELYYTCIDSGVVSEKVNAKMDCPMPVVERFPAVALGCIQQIHRVMQDATKELAASPPPDPVINIVINRQRLEDVLASSDG